MTMEHTEDNHLQEQPLFTIEHETDDPTAEAVGEAPIITIEHETDDPTAEAAGEAPIITIEHYNVEDERQLPPAVKKRSALQTWSLRLLWFVSAAVLLVGLYAATRLYNYYYNLGVSISVSPTDNLRKLDHMRMENGPSEVLLKRDSVLGVALDIYEWHNVKAELTLAEPDTADHNVLLYTRTADYTATGEYIGSLVVDGEEKQRDVSRLGYCALKNGHAVTDAAETAVRFAPMSQAEIDAYVATGEPMGKAGAYAIQGRAAVYIEEIHGSFSNVVGLPLYAVAALARTAGVVMEAADDAAL